MDLLDGFSRAARSAYRRLPLGTRGRLAEIRHGDTWVQRELSARVRDMRKPRGAGDIVVGPARHPTRAVVVESFDAAAHLARLGDIVADILQGEGVVAYRLPHQDPPALVVGASEWDRAWRVLSAAEGANQLWVDLPKRRRVPLSELVAAPRWRYPRIFQRLAAANGALVADHRTFIRVERWDEVVTDDMLRPDGGLHEIGTLVRPDGGNEYASYLSLDVQRGLRDGTLTVYPSIDAVTEPIDLVYTWVDGADPAWLARRARRQADQGMSPDAAVASRFESHDELRYSLRSVEMYASWVRHVYLVTDAQIPAWLDVGNPKLTVVDHRDLFFEEELPVFNSHAIESRLHRIEGLSELFLYLNDDMLFGRRVRPELFFTSGGLVKYFTSPARIDPAPPRPNDLSVSSAGKNNRALLEAALGRTLTAKLKHTPYAHRRSLLVELEERFPEIFAANVAARFRTHGDHSIVSSLAQRYGAVTGRSVEGRIRYNYADISRPDIKQLLARWTRARSFDVFCLNDAANHEMSEAKVAIVEDFLSGYFPLRSEFELP